MSTSVQRQNLFIRAHEAQHGGDFDRVGSGWEDTLTDEFAFLLSADDGARESVIRNLLGKEAEPVMKIRTQGQYEEGCPDLEITLASGKLLLLEHKVDASLGHEQLERYLRITNPSGEPARVALISKKHLQVSDEVLNNDRYFRPASGSHWYWTDVYGWLPESDRLLGADWVRSCFREYFRLLGFARPDLPGRWEELLGWAEESRSVREEFGHRLDPIRTFLTEKGFSITGDSQSGLNAKPPGQNEPYLHLTAGPARARLDLMRPEHAKKTSSAVFRVALVYDSPDSPDDANKRFDRMSSGAQDENGFMWFPVAPHRMSNPRTRLSIVSSLGQFLEDEQTIEDRVFEGFIAAYGLLVNGSTGD